MKKAKRKSKKYIRTFGPQDKGPHVKVKKIHKDFGKSKKYTKDFLDHRKAEGKSEN